MKIFRTFSYLMLEKELFQILPPGKGTEWLWTKGKMTFCVSFEFETTEIPYLLKSERKQKDVALC